MLSLELIQQRSLQLKTWLHYTLPAQSFQMTLLAGDASFRRYYRIFLPEHTLIAVDAPPHLEDNPGFIGIANVFTALGLQVPRIIASELSAGFMLLNDLGDDLYFNVLTTDNSQRLYENAIDKLLIIQKSPQNSGWNFPPFDQALFHQELERFKEWYLLKHLQLTLTTIEERILDKAFDLLINNALNQPQVCVHRDYHSRNLFALADNDVGIIDFQDALWGPITYDLVSLIRDCYIDWPKHQVLQLAMNFYEANGLLPKHSPEQFLLWFDWMGIQRHLKASYIFARKWHRDHNDGYLKDIPRTLNYVLDVSEQYPQLKDFRNFLLQVSQELTHHAHRHQLF